MIQFNKLINNNGHNKNSVNTNNLRATLKSKQTIYGNLTKLQEKFCQHKQLEGYSEIKINHL